MAKGFSFELLKQVAVLGESENGRYSTQVNYISYNGKPPKLDIRKWDKQTGKMYKGIALDENEVKELTRVLNNLEV
jgi:hypothetical protein